MSKNGAVPGGADPAGLQDGPAGPGPEPGDAGRARARSGDGPAVGRGSRGNRLSRGLEKVGLLDWAMVALALLHLLLLTGASSYTALLPAFVLPYLVYADLVFSGIYAVEFVSRMLAADSKAGYVKTHWYDLAGLVPIANTGLRSLRLVRLLRMYVVWRLDWEDEPSWITAFVRSVILRYLDILLSVITRPLMIAMIKIIQVPLRKARFAAMMGAVMDHQRKGVESVALMTLKVNKQTKGLAELGITQKAVHVVTDAVMDQVVAMLKSDELNNLMADAVGDVLTAAVDGMTGSAKVAQDAVPTA